jgi:fumarylpyruvate hydrolase
MLRDLCGDTAMTRPAFELPIPVLPIAGDADTVFPVKRVFCVGRNYADHIREMGKDPERESPFFFMKPASAVVPVPHQGCVISYPPQTHNFQHEIELVAAIGACAANVTPSEALDCIFGYAVGLDMTRRDLQLAARESGRPWEFGKSFGQSAPVGAIQRTSQVGHPRAGAIWLTVNGATRQHANLAELIWSVAECVSFLSAFDALEPGDLLFTGTPAGVGPVSVGDRIHGGIDGIGEISAHIAAG